MPTLVCALLLAGTMSFRSSAQDALEQTPAFHIELVGVGIEGAYKVGHWTSIILHVDGSPHHQRGRFEVIAPDAEGELAIQSDGTLWSLAANTPTRICLHARFGRQDNALRIRWVPIDANMPTTEWELGTLPRAATSTQQLVCLLGDAMDWTSAWQMASRHLDESPRLVQTTAVDRLPDDWRGWEAFDLLVLTGGTATWVNQLTDAQREALDLWVRLGGRLLFAAGDGAEELVGPSGPLERFVPGTFRGTSRQFETTRIEAFAAAQDRLDLLLTHENQNDGLTVVQLNEPRGAVEVAETVGGTRVPLVIRSSHGFGSVVFVAFALDQSPLTEWSGYPRLCVKLLQLAGLATPVEREESEGGQLSHLGFTDLSGQLRAAMEQFPGVRLVAFGWIAVLAVAYVLWIGPGDYLLLRRLGRRWGGTWITFPLSIALLSGLIFYLGRHGQGKGLDTNVVNLVDVDLATGTWRGTAWAHVHAAEATELSVSYDVSKPWHTGDGEEFELFSWHGLPGDSFGGMDGPRRDWLGLAPYRLGIGPSMLGAEGVSMPTGATRAFRAYWWKVEPASSASSLSATPAGHLEGGLVNELPVRLREAKLLFGRWYYDLGDVEANASVDLGDGFSPRSMRNWLARREVVEGRDMATPWDQTSLDVSRIMEMLMFHERAGGTIYTGLTNRYHDWLDMSGLLTSGRAILVGQLDEPPTTWQWEPAVSKRAEAGRWNFARLVIPVQAKGVQQLD